MIKKIFLGLVLLAVIAVALIYFFFSGALNKEIKSGVEKFGPQITQTDVTLESANLSILSGSGTLTGLHIGNPDGYDSKDVFALGEIDLNVDIGSVFSDKVIIEHIIIKQPEISYEKTLMNSNIKELLKNIEEFTGAKDTSAPEPEAESGASKQVVIKKLVIEEGKIYVGLMGVGQTVTLPRIEMTDIGEDGSQVTIAEALDLILTTVLKNIGPAIAEGGGGLGESAGDAVDKATDSIKGLFGK